MTMLSALPDKPDIVSTIGGVVHLKRAGRNFLGLCPFHHEKTPSLSVSPERQRFTCFGCGEKGDVVDFIQKSRGCSFRDALAILGMSGDRRPEDPKRQRQRTRRWDYEKWKATYYAFLCRESIRIHKIDRITRERPSIPEEMAWRVTAEVLQIREIERRLDVFLAHDEAAIFELYEQHGDGNGRRI